MRKLLVSMLVAATAFALVPASIVGASAAEKSSLFMEDTFQDALSTKKWDVATASDSMKLYSAEESGHLSYAYHAEQFLLGTTEKLSDVQSIQFDFQPHAIKWTAIYFAASNDLEVSGDKFSQTDNFYTYTPQIAIRPTSVECWSADLNAAQLQKNYAFDSDWYTIRIEVVDATNANFYISKQGETANVVESKIVLTTDKYSFDELYFFIGCEGGGAVHMDNLKVQSANVTIDENFNDDDVDAKIVPYSVYSSYKYSIEKANSYLSVANAVMGDNIVYNTAIPVEESVISSLECLKAEFNLCFKDAKNDTLSFAFGIGATKAFTDGAYVVDFDADSVAISRYANGAKTALTEKASLGTLDTKLGAKINVIANKDGTISVYGDGALLLETQVDDEGYYAGYFGFAMTEATANTGMILIDNMEVLTAEYKIPVTKSVTHNFSNDYYGNEGFEDFLVNVNGGAMYVKDGKLVWDGLSDWSLFGSAHEYDDFVLEFKLCNVYTSDKTSDLNATALNKWLGLDLGKAAKGEVEYGSNVVLMFDINPTADTINLGYYIGAGSTEDRDAFPQKVIKHKDIPASLLTDIGYDGVEKTETQVLEKDALCVRWVAEDGDVKLYLKKACELEYTLYYTVKDLETTGYSALCCTGYTFLKLDDFSMSNISDVYVCADNYVPETIVETEKEIIYDRGNTDMNGLDETKLNQAASDGCGSQTNAMYFLLPTVLLGVMLLKKPTKKEESHEEK